MDFKNKIVVITGASSGIGKSTAIELAKRGAHLALVARSEKNLSHLKKTLSNFSIKTKIYTCDVSSKNQSEKICKQILDDFKHVNILINNAGFAYFKTIENQSIEEIESQMNTNYFGMVYFTKNLLKNMLNQKNSHIINVASVAASFGLPGITPYCASKFAMLGFSEGLKHELKGSSVGVTVVSPIQVKTNFFNHHPSLKQFSENPTYALEKETVTKIILKAANSNKLELVVPRFVRIIIWLKHTFPFLINPIIGSYFKKKLIEN